jgi:hypothetical protein
MCRYHTFNAISSFRDAEFELRDPVICQVWVFLLATSIPTFLVGNIAVWMATLALVKKLDEKGGESAEALSKNQWWFNTKCLAVCFVIGTLWYCEAYFTGTAVNYRGLYCGVELDGVNGVIVMSLAVPTVGLMLYYMLRSWRIMNHKMTAVAQARPSAAQQGQAALSSPFSSAGAPSSSGTGPLHSFGRRLSLSSSGQRPSSDGQQLKNKAMRNISVLALQMTTVYVACWGQMCAYCFLRLLGLQLPVEFCMSASLAVKFQPILNVWLILRSPQYMGETKKTSKSLSVSSRSSHIATERKSSSQIAKAQESFKTVQKQGEAGSETQRSETQESQTQEQQHKQ